jgi:hypothetical protein
MIAKRNVTQKKFRPLGFHSSLHLSMAANWLALGQIEEATAEFSQLPTRARHHPQASMVYKQLSELFSQDESTLQKGGLS